MELDLWPLLLYCAQRGAVVDQQRGGVYRIQRHPMGVSVHEFFQLVGVVTRHPARQVEVAAHDAGLDAVLMLQPVGHHLKLQLADRAQQQQRPGNRAKYLNCAFFTQLRKPGSQLLGAQRVGHFNSAKHFWRKKRKARELQRFAFGQRIAQLKHAVVWDANDVARKSGV